MTEISFYPLACLPKACNSQDWTMQSQEPGIPPRSLLQVAGTEEHGQSPTARMCIYTELLLPEAEELRTKPCNKGCLQQRVNHHAKNSPLKFPFNCLFPQNYVNALV